ncbi:DNA recombination protein RmuC [Streptococcus cuniculipharyngis]|uniref:DNA recombination protein RmuC n=1 Tax=Streptococcus cuniculipharyngis TaxID=1562651 RepID=A0A5C5SBA5_9STRE|nr:DNA recombination protein RmuC [Streptococcus cuniculipharyngis]TWS97630.1 DNA recombination protein RmuC [Streptococcus cuniculipharyngis]
MTLALFFLTVSLLVGLYLLFMKSAKLEQDLKQILEAHADNLSDQLTYQLELVGKNQQLDLASQMNRLQADLNQQLSDLHQVLNHNLTQNRDWSDRRLEAINNQLFQAVKDMQASNESKLETMRQTVEEKLDKTLHLRLQSSFDSVSRQLESVNKGLGEMQTVARDVGTLNKILSGSKTRGILGELQLGQIIEDILSPQQYEREYVTVSGSSDRVEYAIKLPAQGEEGYVYLPVDAKFPLEDYYRLEEAYELGDKPAIEQARKSLQASVKGFAKAIQSKYLNPPATTPFAIMFLPTESLYAEIVRQADFFDRLRREQQVLVAGPSTLAALLNSLSVGFKTLNIQKNAQDISKILGQVKTEFNQFGGILAKTQKQLRTASNSLDTLMTTRTKALVRVLDQIDNYDDRLPQTLLDAAYLGEDNDENKPNET